MLAAQTLKIHIDGDERAYWITLAVEGGAATSIKSRREPSGGHGKRQRVAVRASGLYPCGGQSWSGGRLNYKFTEVVSAQSLLPDQVPNALDAGWRPRRCAGRRWAGGC